MHKSTFGNCKNIIFQLIQKIPVLHHKIFTLVFKDLNVDFNQMYSDIK
jgi:hypothetical protein